ncbi:PREDICTED: ninjurin-1-like [Rhagoletis zephyria]|uniref:ninjurin-1-like n=1 Tax=Rhagoletis zephyria TaxID=28612 RepID=UPI0008114E61|nr:PREDICTED: ninjurin-1-like [Rhagoletis zephyria]
MSTAPQPNGLLHKNSGSKEEESFNIEDLRSEKDQLTYKHFMESERNEIDGPIQIPEEMDALEDFASVDVNAYAHKKTLAQGMMDLALLTANANQLRYVLDSYNRHPYYYPSLIFLLLSIGFQIAVGVGLILTSRYNIEDKREVCRAEKFSNYTICGIFIVTVINVFISAFGVADAPDDK